MYKAVYSIFIFGIIGLFNVNSQSISGSSDLPENALIYFLPETKFVVEISYTRTISAKGQFADYSTELLGFEPMVKENNITFQLLGANIESIETFDRNLLFFLAPEKAEIKFEAIEKMANNGLIIVDVDPTNIMLNGGLNNPSIDRKPVYIPYESLYNDYVDTTYRRELRDSTYVNVPYYERKYILKEESDHAREAADLILWLQYNLLKSTERLNPEDEYDPNVSKSLFDENKNLLNHYLSFFNGDETTDTLVYRTVITPEKGLDKYELCGFTQNQGIVSSKQGIEKIVLTIQDEELKNDFEKTFEKLKKYKDRLVYRIPENVTVDVKYGNTILCDGIFSVPQLGMLLSLPPRMVIGK